MVNKVIAVLCLSLLVFSVSTPMFAQDASGKSTASKSEQARWEGYVVRSSSDQSTLDVRKRGTNEQKTIHYDSSTKWTSQEHGSKKVNDIDASQVKDGDRVICVGKFNDKGEFQATLISKRLSK